jgi:hypothetical protein
VTTASDPRKAFDSSGVPHRRPACKNAMKYHALVNAKATTRFGEIVSRAFVAAHLLTRESATM